MNGFFQIDDTTWNDLDMDEVLKIVDTCKSSVGKEYLRKSLHDTCLDEGLLLLRSDKSDCLANNNALLKGSRKAFSDLGITKKTSFRDYIFRLSEIKPGNNIKHVIMIVLLIAAIVMLFIKPLIGIFAIVAMFAVNISTYFAEKGRIEGYFQCIKYLCGMVICAGKLTALGLSGTPFEDDGKRLKELIGIFGPVKRGSWLITNSVSGSLVDVIMDYVRMLFHVDLIKFNSSVKTVTEHGAEVDELYNILGEFELAACIHDFREKYPVNCRPEFTPDKKVSFTGLYHPLISAPVTNSLNAEGSVLLTGSNASGKSTFLKSIAINQILAQSLYSCLTEQYCCGFFKVMSSMALKDNILDNESYFVVEVKSLKRIFDTLGDVPVMCFVDEVLRGTNTGERIAASTVILKRLSTSNAVVFAATHDIELCTLLEGYMKNYHFSETVTDTVTFDYKLKDGPSTSRNAIKLLDMYGFDKTIVEEAERLAKSR